MIDDVIFTHDITDHPAKCQNITGMNGKIISSVLLAFLLLLFPVSSRHGCGVDGLTCCSGTSLVSIKSDWRVIATAGVCFADEQCW